MFVGSSSDFPCYSHNFPPKIAGFLQVRRTVAFIAGDQPMAYQEARAIAEGCDLDLLDGFHINSSLDYTWTPPSS